MAEAILARIDGDTFQARIFWRKACRLLDPESPLLRVGFESGPKGYDDIWVEYQTHRGVQDQFSIPLVREHTQCKWHVAPDSYGYAQLIDPEFINANSKSLLQRALAAQKIHAVDGKGARFRLLTNWRIERNDPLRQLVHQRSHTLRLDLLFGTKTDRSAMGAVRKLWCEHLGLTEIELRLLTRTLAFSEATDSLEQLREELDPLFRIAGLKRVPAHESAFVYDQVIYRWMAQKRLEFDRSTLGEACAGEGLLADAVPALRIFGVKSFEHATDRLEERCTAVLDLVPDFLDRQIRPNADWQTTVYPRLKSFLLSAALSGDRLRLVLDAHLSLSFAAGSILNIKSGRVMEIEQRTLGKVVWAADDAEPNSQWSTWNFSVEERGKSEADLAVAVNLTHDTSPKVQAYVESALPDVQLVLFATPSCGAGARSVVCGRHAFDLAESLTAQIKSIRERKGLGGRVHLFMAAPGGFSFALGQRQVALGAVTLYEFDFEGTKGGSYEPALSLPIS